MAAKAWKLLEKKIMAFNEKYPGSSLVCMGLISNVYVTAGSEEMKSLFVKRPEVEAMYKEAILNQTFQNNQQQDDEQGNNLHVENEAAIKDVLKKHVFDLDIGLMRSVISSAVSPGGAISNKDARRNWYREENCPQWWRDTGIPFQSVNHTKVGSNRLTRVPIMTLVEALQRFLGISPMLPLKKNKTEFRSCFLCPEETGREQPFPEPEENPVSDDTDQTGGEQPVEDPEQHPEEMEFEETGQQPAQIPEEVTVNGSQKRQNILGIFRQELSWDEKCLKVMKLLNTWDDLVLHGDLIKDNLPKIPQQLANDWRCQKLIDVNKRYKDFIPLSIGERLVLQSTPNGNCIFNTFSIVLFGNECMAMVLKLACVVNMVDDVMPFTKYIVEEYKDDISLWVHWATSGCSNTSEMSQVDMENICRHEMLETIKHPYMDGSLFHIHLMTHLLKRPVQQHCVKKNYTAYWQLLFPPLGDFSPAPIHILWVPCKPKSLYASINHVVPAVCKLGPYATHIEECAFVGLGVCAFMGNFNSKERSGWVECTLCGQWVHEICMGVSAADFSLHDDFPCGCDALRNGIVPLHSMDYYESLKFDDLDIDFKALVENVRDKISLRNTLFRRDGNRLMKLALRLGRFGPFTDDFIDSVNECLHKEVDPDEHALVPDVYMPEVLLKIIEQKEKVNRLLAEMVLLQKNTTLS